MSLAFNFIVALIVFSPTLAFWTGASAMLCQMLLVAISLFAVAVSARHSDSVQVRRATDGILWIFLLPPLLSLMQLIPMPVSWAHPVWRSANEALGDPGFGYITVDRGATTSELLSTIAIVGLVITTVTVGRDRRRAELILVALAAITTLLSLAFLVQNIPSITASLRLKISETIAINLVGVGLVLNSAVLIMALERRETRHQAATPFLTAAVVAIVGMIINLAVLTQTSATQTIAVVAVGFSLLALLVTIRRLDLGRWSVAVLLAAFAAALMILLGWLYNGGSGGSALLRLVQPPTASIQMERILADARWLGSGAGTFEILARIYQDSAEPDPLSPPSTAVSWALEIGWLGLFGAIIISFILLAKLLAGALRRGRDWFYAGAGAASLAFITINGFVGPGLGHPVVATTLAITIGLGLAQGFSQTARS